MKNSFLTPGLRRMLCNALIQPHFDYACPTWYPNLNVKLFCLKLDKMHIFEDFKPINWLPVDQREQESSHVTFFKCVYNVCPYYIKVFKYTSQVRISSRNDYARIKVPF